MPRKKRQNPFDELCRHLDPQASFATNAKRMYSLLVNGKFDMHVAAEILVEASVMPNLARENQKLCDAIKELTQKLEVADECIRDATEQRKELAIASQEGCDIDMERRTMRLLKFPKGPTVN